MTSEPIMNNWLKISMVPMQCTTVVKELEIRIFSISYLLWWFGRIAMLVDFFLKIYFPKSQQVIIFSPSETAFFQANHFNPGRSMSLDSKGFSDQCNSFCTTKQNGEWGPPHPRSLSAGSRGLWAGPDSTSTWAGCDPNLLETGAFVLRIWRLNSSPPLM